jgi:hypothetical protein
MWGATATAVAGVTAAVWLWPSAQFFLRQLNAANRTTAPRPGDGFYRGLFDAKCALSTAWGFWAPGDFWGANPCSPPALIAFLSVVAVIFTVCLVLGGRRLIRTREYGLLCALAVILAGAAYMVLVQHYDYGAYKFLSTGWFIAAFVMIEGVIAAAAAASLAPAMAFVLVLLILLTPQAIILSVRLARFDAAYPYKSIEFYRKAAEIRDIVGKAPLVVALSEGVTAHWLVLFLRDMKLAMVNRPHPYFHNFDRKPLAQAWRRDAIGKVQWVVTDSAGDLGCRNFKLVWQGGPYRLWRSVTPSDIFAKELATPEPGQPSLTGIRCPGP